MNNLCYGCMQEKNKSEEICSNCGYNNKEARVEPYYLQAGTLLNNRYLVGKVLGHGGFGITYIGLDQKLDVKVAIKEYLPADVASRDSNSTLVSVFSGDKEEQYHYGLDRFLQEAKMLAKYNDHPGIVSTYDFFDENNTAYLVMEYLEGITLSTYIERKDGRLELS